MYKVDVDRATEDGVTDFHTGDLPGLRGPYPGRDSGLVIGDIEAYRANCLCPGRSELQPSIKLRIGGLNELDDGVVCVIRVGRKRDLILGALEPN